MSEDAIRRTLFEYCRLIDDGRFDEWAELFVEDGRFSILGSQCASREEIRAFAHANFPHTLGKTKHLTLNPIIDVDGDTATAVSDVVVLYRTSKGPLPTLAGRYHDELAFDGAKWRLVQRDVVVPDGWTRSK